MIQIHFSSTKLLEWWVNSRALVVDYPFARVLQTTGYIHAAKIEAVFLLAGTARRTNFFKRYIDAINPCFQKRE